MGNSTVKLYYDCRILNDRNMIVDDVESYLATLTPTIMEDFQFIKHDLSISIKIDTEEIGANINSGNILNPFAAGKLNYVSIQNETDYSPIYYFVIDQEWTAVRTIKLYLALDTLNTFKYNVAYSFDKKTLVLREHKDRFYKDKKLDGYIRKIDFESEGISPLLYQTLNDTKIIDEKANFDWYLLYMADNTKSSVSGETLPVNAFIMAEEPITTALINYGLKIADLNQSKVYWFGKNVSNSFTSGNVEIDGIKYSITEAMFVMYSVNVGWFLAKATGNNGTTKIRNLDSTSILIFDESKEIDVTEQSSLRTILAGDLSSIGGRIFAAKTAVVTPSQQAGEQGIDDIFTVDRTDTRISKILKLPYCPFNVQISEGNINIPSELERTAVKWENEKTYNYLKIKTNFLQAFQNNINVFIPTNPLSNLVYHFYISDDIRNYSEESKLYHSDFQNFRFVYDSFQFVFEDEKISETFVRNRTNLADFTLKFITTSTMNSRFLFDFSDFMQYETSKFIENYPYILTIARNNEIPIFNSEYINYIRNGYNYDVKARNASIVSASLGIVSNAAQVALTPLTVGKSIKNVATAAAGLEAVKTGVTSQKYKSALAAVEEAKKGVATASQIALSNAFGAVSGIINGINSIRQTETAFEQKQKAMKMANVSVESSDDIDLLSYYSENRAYLKHCRCSKIMEKALADLFYYQGYINNEQKIPDVNSRKWFNFLKCEPLLINNKNIDDKYLENIKERFEIGVTFYHKNNDSWDFAQETANREIWLNV